VLLKVGDEHAEYEDGDIIAALSDRRIKHVHSAALCHKKHADRRSNGLIVNDSLTHDYCKQIYEYRFERLSRDELRITRLPDGSTIRIKSGEPFTGFDGREQHMEIEEFVRRRRHSDDSRDHLPMFGEDGGEIWYGGRCDFSETTLDTIWDAIEQKRDVARTDSDFQLWPFGHLDIHHHLPVRVDSMTESEAQEWIQPKYKRNSDGDLVLDEDGSPIVEKKRKHYLPWRDILDDLGVTESEVLDRGKAVGREKTVKVKRYIGQSKDQPGQPPDKIGGK